MLKWFCDICNKEINYKTRIDISGLGEIRNATYCVDCFQDPKNWESIRSKIVTQAKSQKLTLAG